MGKSAAFLVFMIVVFVVMGFYFDARSQEEAAIDDGFKGTVVSVTPARGGVRLHTKEKERTRINRSPELEIYVRSEHPNFPQVSSAKEGDEITLKASKEENLNVMIWNREAGDYLRIMVGTPPKNVYFQTRQ